MLTHKTADFGILSANRVLHIVELEKPHTRLVKQSGGVHNQLQKGLDQIRDWRVVVEDHRIALLHELGFKDDEVHAIQYLLIAGSSATVSTQAMVTLRRNSFAPDIHFKCFDELATSLQQIEEHLHSL